MKRKRNTQGIMQKRKIYLLSAFPEFRNTDNKGPLADSRKPGSFSQCSVTAV